MKKLEIQKTSAAYTLRYDRPMRAMCLTTAVCIFLFGSIVSAVPWLIYGAKPPVGMVFWISSFFMAAPFVSVSYPADPECR